MTESTKFITNSVYHILKVFELMKQPNGTSIEELCKELNINRRSVFRLLKDIEQKFHEPYTMHRSSFGGAASYHLSSNLIENLSEITLPELHLTFSQAAFVYLVLKDNAFSRDSCISREIDQLWRYFEAFYTQ